MIAELKKSSEHKMQKSLEALKADLGKVRTGRAHTGLLDHVQVDYYGSPVPIPQVANVTLIDARTIGVQPWEKTMVSKVEKAIRDTASMIVAECLTILSPAVTIALAGAAVHVITVNAYLARRPTPSSRNTWPTRPSAGAGSRSR